MNQHRRCLTCTLVWTQPYPRTGPREQCWNCGAVRYSGRLSLDQDEAVRSIAAAAEMHVAGLLPTIIGKNLELLGEETLSKNHVLRWCRQCTQIAQQDNPAPRTRGGEDWVLVSMKPHPDHLPNLHMDVVMDTDSQLILAVRARSPDETPAEALKTASRGAVRPPKRIITNLKRADIEPVLRSAIRQTQNVKQDTVANITRNTRLAEVLRALEKRENTRGNPSHEFMQNLLTGIQQDLNFYRSISAQNPTTPSEQAGMKPAYAGWDQVALQLLVRNRGMESVEAYRASRNQTETTVETAKREDEGGSAAPRGRVAPGQALVRQAAQQPVEPEAHQEVRQPLLQAAQTDENPVQDQGNQRLLLEIRAFLDDVEPQRERVRERLRKHEEATEAAWKLFTSLDSGKPAGQPGAAHPQAGQVPGPDERKAE